MKLSVVITHFASLALKKHLLKLMEKKCPICCSFLKIAEAVQIHRSIECLDVYCEYEKNGCKWIGQVEAIENT